MQLDELVRDGKPQPRSGGLPIGAAVTLTEPLEDRLAQLGRNTWTGIVDGHGQLVAPEGDIHADRASRRHELECVGQQVHRHTLQLRRVDGGNERRGRLHDKVYVTFVGEDVEVRSNETDQRGNVGRAQLDLELAGLQLGDVQKVVHVLEEHARIAGDDLRDLQLALARERQRVDSAGVRRGR